MAAKETIMNNRIRRIGTCVALGGVALLAGCVGVPTGPSYGSVYSEPYYYSDPSPVIVSPPVYIDGGYGYGSGPRYYGRPGYYGPRGGYDGRRGGYDGPRGGYDGGHGGYDGPRGGYGARPGHPPRADVDPRSGRGVNPGGGPRPGAGIRLPTRPTPLEGSIMRPPPGQTARDQPALADRP